MALFFSFQSWSAVCMYRASPVFCCIINFAPFKGKCFIALMIPVSCRGHGSAATCIHHTCERGFSPSCVHHACFLLVQGGAGVFDRRAEDCKASVAGEAKEEEVLSRWLLLLRGNSAFHHTRSRSLAQYGEFVLLAAATCSLWFRLADFFLGSW